MDLSWTTDHRDGVTLVACRLRNSGPIARRVRVENELDGPVLPPRSHGEPLPGWDADGVILRIEPKSTAAIGYAVPAPAAEPPATIAFDEPVRKDAADATRATGRSPDVAAGSDQTGIDPSVTDPSVTDPSATDPSATDAVRTLGAYRPPRAAVTGPESDHSESKTTTAAPDADTVDADEADGADHGVDSAEYGADAVGPDADGDNERPTDGRPSTTTSADLPTASPADPAAVNAWLDAVERRIARAERLDGADVPTATEAVAIAGGLDAVRDLDEKVGDDAERLRTVAERAAALADRAAEAEVPTEPLGRLA